MFDRVIGEPLYGMEERPVKRSGDAGDGTWPTQPFPFKPGPIGRVGMTRDDINKMTPEIEKFCTDFWDTNNIVASGRSIAPAQDQAMVTFGAPVGGWGPLSYNPQLGYVFMNVHERRELSRRRARRWLAASASAMPAALAAARGRWRGGGRQAAARCAVAERGAGGGQARRRRRRYWRRSRIGLPSGKTRVRACAARTARSSRSTSTRGYRVERAARHQRGLRPNLATSD